MDEYSAMAGYISPFYYFTSSFVVACVAVLYLRHCSSLAHQYDGSTQDLLYLPSLPSYPIICLCLFNFLVSCILGVYYLLCSMFFGPQAAGPEQMVVFEQLLNFFSFKFIIVGLVPETDALRFAAWIIWFINLAVAKGLVYHGHIHVERLAGRTAPLACYLRPGCHVLFVAVYVAIAVAITNSLHIWSQRVTTLWIFLLYDLVTVSLEALHCLALYCLHGSHAANRLQHVDVYEYIYIIDCCTDILLQVASFLHFLHVGLVLGISLSLVDIVLFLNIRAVGIQLVKKILELLAFFKVKNSIDDTFPTISCTPSAEDSSPASADKPSDPSTFSDTMCPICLQDMRVAKLLPCGHCMHLDCLKQLIRKPSNSVTTGGAATETLMPGIAADTGGGVRLLQRFHTVFFKCPLCRKTISSCTGQVVEDKQPTPASISDGEPERRPQGAANTAAAAPPPTTLRQAILQRLNYFFIPGGVGRTGEAEGFAAPSYGSSRNALMNRYSDVHAHVHNSLLCAV